MNRTVKAGVALVAAAACGAAVTIAVRGTPAPASPHPPPIGTTTVVRTDLASTVLTQGTLGYTTSPPVVNSLSGTYTNVLASGTVVQPGQTLYRVDNEPVVLLLGGVPAWRPFAPGMADGPDVQELEANLIALGDAHGLFSVPGPHYGAAAVAAVERWQSALGYPANGSIGLGTVTFMPAAVRIAEATVALGQAASPGDTPYRVTTTTRAVSVALTPNDPTVSIGQAVSIQLPSGSTTPGMVTAEDPPASPSGSSSSSNPSGSSSGSTTSLVLTVTPADPAATGSDDGVPIQVALTVQSVHNVLAVPIAALVALAGGGYGLESVDHSGQHHLIGVQTGVFAGGDVQVLGSGLTPGVRVVVAQ